MSDEPPAAVAEPLDLGEVNDGGYQEIDPALLHARFDEVGLHFGPTFRGIRKLWRKGRQVVGFAELPEGLEGTDEGYCFHPAFFDACWQAVAAAVSEEEFRNRPVVYIPVSIRRLRFHRTPGRQVWIRGELKTLTDRIFEGDATFYDETGRPFLEIEGVRCQAIEARRGDRGEVRDWLFDVEWVHKPRPEATAGGRPEADFLPSCRDLRPLLETRAHDGARKLGWGRRLNEATRRYDSLAADYVLEALRELGCPPEPGTVLEPDDLIARYDLLPRLQRPLKRLLSLLEVCGYASRKGPGSWRLEAAAAASDASAACRDLFARFPGAYSEISLIARCGRAIAAVLKGRTDPLELLFPEGISGGTECFYQDAPGSGIPNTAARAALEEIASRLPSDRTLRVLEIGGGTGGLTAHVLPVLPADRTEYVFTDISAPFLQMAERKFSGRDFVTYRPFDLEKDPLSQGLEAGGFDVVLAANVLHATKDLRRSLAHIRSLLAPRGMVLLVEVDPSQRWTDAVFGLTEGWWRFEDTDLRSESPLLDAPRWRSLLETVGFREVEGVDVSPKGATSTQIVVLARGPEASGKTDEPAGGNGSRPEEEDPAVEEREPGAWVLFADRSGVAEEIARLLEARGQTCVLVKPSDAFRRSGPALFDVSPDAPDDMARLLESLPPSPEVRGFVHLWSLDADESVPSRFLLAERLGCHAVMHLVQAMEKIGRTGGSTKLLLVTRGAQPVGRFGEGIHQSPLLGLGRTIFNEAPWIDIRSVDLDPDPSRRDAVAIHEELWSADREEEIALRGVERFAPRLRPAPAVRVPVGLDAPDRADFEVVAAGAGVLDQIFLRRFRADPPGPGMVQIEVQAAALNFRDVMKGLNLYPTENDADRFLGDECAGRIIAVGDAVEGLAVGDEVVAMTPASFRSRVNAHAAFVIPKPSNRTFEEAVTIPVAFLTAAYGLHHLGRIAEGEKVLIHSGAGGVGLAAVQLAKAAGAEVFATAGNAEKRELLELLGVDHVLDSRSLEFADRVMEITRGRGVDIVLNSLAGKALAKSLSCLAPSGRFLELGKIDIYQNSRLGLRAFRKNISFFAIDLSRLVLEKPGLIRGMLLDLARRFEEDGLAPLPHRVFGVSRAAEAFRTMAKARHVGKVVLSFGERGLTAEAESAGPPAFRKDGTYLITGGLGGFGRSLASWIVENGGGHLMLVGRSGAEGEGAQEAVASLRAAGARVETAAADVSRADDVARVLSFVRSSMPPLRGVFHAAMVLSDGVIMQLDARRFRKVTAPKVEGAWNLHEQTAGVDLDHFVLFSSVSAIIGNQGQANYAAANVFLDALAHTRRAAGLPGLSVNLGRLSGVGYLAGQEDLEELLDRKGVLGLTAPQALKALGHLLGTGPAQMGVLRMDWPLWVRSLASPRLPQRLAAIIDDDFGSLAGDDRTRAREAIFAAPPEERPGMARLYVVEQVAKVLGASAKQLDADRPLNELGFDSLMAVELKNKVETDLSINIPARELLDVPTIDRLVLVVLSQLGLAATAPADRPPSPEDPAGLVVALRRAGGAVPPLVLFHPTGGDLGMYKSLVSCLPQDVAVFGIRSRRIAGLGANAGSIDAMAGEYIKALLSGIPSGPRYLLGFSFGGLVAMTAAAMLEEMGEPVAGVGLVDASPQWADPTFPKDLVLKKRLAELYGFLRKELGSAEPGDGDGALAEFDAPVDEILSAGAEDRVQLISRWISLRGYLPGRVPKDAMEDYVARFESDMSLIETFQPRAIRAPISVWWPRDRRSHIKEPVGGWTPYSPEVTEAFIEGDHYTMMSPPGVHALADQLRRVLMGSESVPAT
jgi:NADPH:quinone reductase-like Zn-dependent oxidoreductase/thioesterase domain-containing protein/SAM-dependent methyltransferase/acyl carrier protein/NADP-dependent 3-hydroxy acid dehydrogenase YdfG